MTRSYSSTSWSASPTTSSSSQNPAAFYPTQECTLVIAVPFLYPIHASPTSHDYRRFTDEDLAQGVRGCQLTVVHSEALGTGVFCAAASLVWHALPPPLGWLIWFAGPLIRLLDRLHARLARTNRPEGTSWLPGRTNQLSPVGWLAGRLSEWAQCQADRWSAASSRDKQDFLVAASDSEEAG